MKIHPDYLSLDDLLKKRLFRIPEYQRCYSWGRRQRRDLFEDIRTLAAAGDDDRIHFMATIVRLRRERRTIVTDAFDVIEVVDGQQRLTTLILIYKAICKALDATDPVQAAVAAEVQKLLVKGDELSLLLLQTNHDTGDHFVRYLRSGDCPPTPPPGCTLAERALLDAIKDCESFVAEWKQDLLGLAAIIKNRLTSSSTSRRTNPPSTRCLRC